MPAKYGYKSSKLITKLTFVDKGGMGLVADGWPYYSASGDILPGVDHPFEFPDETRKIRAVARLSTTDRRNVLRLLAACMADWWLPRRAFAQRASARAGTGPDRRG